VKIDFGARCRKFAAAIERIDPRKLYLQSAQEIKDLALDLNRLQLQAEGVDSEGKKLGQYSPATKRIKQAKGQDISHITLLDTGEFQGKLFLDTKQLPIFIGSKDSKTPKIFKRFGPGVLGLTERNEKGFGNEVTRVYKDKINGKIEDLKNKILL
jgi:hypothetical protein